MTGGSENSNFRPTQNLGALLPLVLAPKSTWRVPPGPNKFHSCAYQDLMRIIALQFLIPLHDISSFLLSLCLLKLNGISIIRLKENRAHLHRY